VGDGAGLCPAQSTKLPDASGVEEGAHGGTMGSPVLNREDALIMWKDAVGDRVSGVGA
jgi:hypothetical protein